MTHPVAIAYFSGAGHTAKLANAIAGGIGEARVLDVSDMDAASWDILDAAPAIVFGAPTYMGSTAAAFDVFLEEAAERWFDGVWRDKIAAGFTVASHGSGDKLSALMRLSIYAAQMGMIWVGQAEIGGVADPSNAAINRDGSWLGLMATSSRDKSELIEPEDLESARLFGTRIAGAVQRWG